MSRLRGELERRGCPLTNSICDTRLVITKLSREKRIRREIGGLLRLSHPESEASTKKLDVVRATWIQKCLAEGHLIDYPFKDEDKTWRFLTLPSISSTSPRKSARSPDIEPESEQHPVKKRRTRTSPEQSPQPSVLSDRPGSSASSEDPSATHPRKPHAKKPSSGNSSDNAVLPFDCNEAFACRRRSPLICPNQTFVDLLVEIKLARELSLYHPVISV